MNAPVPKCYTGIAITDEQTIMLKKIYISKKMTKVQFPPDTPWTT